MTYEIEVVDVDRPGSLRTELKRLQAFAVSTLPVFLVIAAIAYFAFRALSSPKATQHKDDSKKKKRK